MSVILVAEQDAGFAASIAEHLKAEGWQVHRVDGRDAAFQAATTMKPGLLLASASMPDARALLSAFSRRRGGPGAVVMVPAPQAGQVQAADFDADVLLAKPFSDVDLKNTVRACLAQAAQDTTRPSAEGIQSGGQQLTSADIFGDVLAEVEAEATRARRAASKARKRTSKDEIERKLEETLSGVLLSDLKPRRSAERSDAPKPTTSSTAQARPKRKEELPTEREIDDLLDKTLSSLELPTRARKTAPKSPASAPQTAAPQPAAPQPAAPQPAAPAPRTSSGQEAAFATQETAPPVSGSPGAQTSGPILDAAMSLSSDPVTSSGSPPADSFSPLPELSPPPAFEPPPSFQAPPTPPAEAPNPALTGDAPTVPEPLPSFDAGPPSEAPAALPSISDSESAPPLETPSQDLLPSIDVALPESSPSSTPPLDAIPEGTFEPLVGGSDMAKEAEPWTPPPALSTPPAEAIPPALSTPPEPSTLPTEATPEITPALEAPAVSEVGKTSGAFAIDGEDPWRDLRGLSSPDSFDDTGTEAGAFTLKEDEATSNPWQATAPEDLFPDSFGGNTETSPPAFETPSSAPPPETPPAAAAEPFEPPPQPPTPAIGSSSFEPAPLAAPVSEAQLSTPAMPAPPDLDGPAPATEPETDGASNPLDRFRSFLDQVDDDAPPAPPAVEPSAPEPPLGTGSFTPPPFGAGSLDSAGMDPGSESTDSASFVSGTGAFTPPPFDTAGTDSAVSGTGSFATGTGAFTPPPLDTSSSDSAASETGSFVSGTGAFTPPPLDTSSSDSAASETGSFVSGTGAFVPPATDTGGFTPPPAALPPETPPVTDAADALQGVLELRGGDENTAVSEVSGGQPFGDYTLLDRIAVGGMAEVWRARRSGVEGFQKTVAIKKILSHLTDSTDFIDMFIDEAKLAAQLTHNNIIQIYDLGKVDDDYFIAMEFVDGKDLRTILKKSASLERPLPLNLALMIVAALARALDYAHRKKGFDDRALGLVHRDVSPQNVLISYEGEIKLCDFGIVKAVAKASTTQMGALKGKLQYMSPEQAWGKSVDSRSDIFSLGSVLFEVLSGEKLFIGDSEIGVLDAVRECRIRSLLDMRPELPPVVDRIVGKALEQDPADRYATAGDMEKDIQDVLRDLDPGDDSKGLSAYMASLFQPALEAPSFEPISEGSAVYVPPMPGEPSSSSDAIMPPPSQGPPEPPADGAAPATPAETPAKGGRGKLLGGVLAIVVLALAAAAFFLMQSDSGDPAPADTPAPATAPTTPPEPASEMPTEEGAPEDEEAAVDEGAADGETPDGAEPAADSGAGTETSQDDAADTPAAADGAAGDSLDIEALVKEGLDAQQSELKERLESEYEAKRRELEEKLAEAQKDSESSEPPPDDN